MESHFTVSTKLALAFLGAVFAAQVYQAATRQIGSGEAYLYDRFVRPTTREILASELPDRDVLYSLMEKRSVGLFHVSPFAVRLPGVLFGLLYLWSIWRIARRVLGVGGRFLGLLVLGAGAPLWYGWFSRADGSGTALALVACGVCLAIAPKKLNLAGACFGLAVAARLDFAIPAAVAGLASVAGKRWTDWTDRVVVPAVVVAVIFLVLPLSHAHRAPEITLELTEGQAIDLHSTLEVLRADAGVEHIRIGASPSAEPVVNFYRAQHRATTWERAVRDYASQQFDYYLLSTRDSGWLSQRHVLVLHRDADFVLARRNPAAM
jgi:hypothetical protein